jgi:Uncharacterized protein conserved in bacteria (DUF2188)
VARGWIHTVHERGRWVNKVESGPYLSPFHRTKDEAVQAGRTEARLRGTDHVIHNVDGTTAEQHSYAHGPFRPLH